MINPYKNLNLDPVREKLLEEDIEKLCTLWKFLNSEEGKLAAGFDEIKEMVLHTPTHSENLIKLANNFYNEFTEEIDSYFSKKELNREKSLFYLYAALLLHDVGLSELADTEERRKKFSKLVDYNELRKNHGEKIIEWINSNKEYLTECGLEEQDISRIGLICKYHTKNTTEELLQEDHEDREIPIRLLICLLRILDACDINKNRVTKKGREFAANTLDNFKNVLEEGNYEEKSHGIIINNIKFLELSEPHYKMHLHFWGSLFKKRENDMGNIKAEIIFIPAWDKSWNDVKSTFEATKEENKINGPKEDTIEELSVGENVVRRTLNEAGIDFSDDSIRLFDPIKDIELINIAYPLEEIERLKRT